LNKREFAAHRCHEPCGAQQIELQRDHGQEIRRNHPARRILERAELLAQRHGGRSRSLDCKSQPEQAPHGARHGIKSGDQPEQNKTRHQHESATRTVDGGIDRNALAERPGELADADQPRERERYLPDSASRRIWGAESQPGTGHECRGGRDNPGHDI
jgi:hypothetical protein